MCLIGEVVEASDRYEIVKLGQGEEDRIILYKEKKSESKGKNGRINPLPKERICFKSTQQTSK